MAEALAGNGAAASAEHAAQADGPSSAQSRPWFATLLSYAGRCRGKMAASFVFSVASVAFGLVPFYAVYRVMAAFIVEGAPDAATLAWWFGAAAIGYVASKILFGVSTVLSHVSAYTILETLRCDVVDKLMATSLGTAASQSIGAVKNVFCDRIEGIEVPLAHMIPELSGSALLALAIAAWLVLIDWRIALACLVTVPLGLAVFAGGLSSYNRMYAAYMADSNRVNSIVVEYIEGIQVVKAFNQTSRSYAAYTDAVRSFKEFTLGWFKSTWVGMNLAFSILPTTLLGALPCGLWLYQAGQVAPTEMAMAFVLALAVVGPLTKLSAFLNEAKSMEYAVADADAFLRLPELPCVEQDAALDGSCVELANVSFAYEGGADVLHGIDLVVEEGSFTAIVGPSGGGKSTIARLAARHWDVREGSVSVGGVDVRDMPLEQLAQTVSYVAQDNYLFDCSLRENIRLGRPDSSDVEVEAAADAACCGEFIARLPQGLDTPAGEAGHLLSGGERQRISIARALLKDAPVVVLDEATAFADPESEHRIQQSIARLTQGKTVLVIAHRLSTVVNADRICVVEGGRVVAAGRHEELLECCALYRSMWEAHVGASTWIAARRKGACRA